MKYIVVTGGVISGLGKGITIASIGRILKCSNLRVTAIKVDPYLNVDAGTMSPFEHGETFILDDGGETDLDLGNYERFLDVTLTAKHNITSGKVYKEVIKRERRGDYLGKTVQMVPHVTDMIQSWFKEVSKIPVDGTGLSPDVCLIEVGGTVGDIESMVFLEALRQFQFTVGRENIVFVHVSMVPVTGGEPKSKPTQHSVKELRALGLSPDILVCRAPEELSMAIKQKISTFCHVAPSHIISNYDVNNIYHVPLVLAGQNMHGILRQRLALDHMTETPNLTSWQAMVAVADNQLAEKVHIGIVGKYIAQQDSYLSLVVAIKHAAILLDVDVVVHWIEATDLEPETTTINNSSSSSTNNNSSISGSGSAEKKLDNVSKHTVAWNTLRAMQGILIPGGFGQRGILGKIAAAQYAREQSVPCLGICLGLQVMVIEYARSVLQWTEANSQEFDESCRDPVVVFMPEINQQEMGGTMRLGVRGTTIVPTVPLSSPTAATATATATATDSKETDVGVGVGRTASLASIVYGLDAGEVSVPVVLSTHHPTATTTTSANNTTGAINTTSATGMGSTTNGQEHQLHITTSAVVFERHRHRYEVNPEKVEALEKAGLYFTGRSDDDQGLRMEIVELPQSVHPFYFGVQYHPEVKSRPTRPSPPIFAFCAASAGRRSEKDLKCAGRLWQEHEERLSQEIVSVVPAAAAVSLSVGGGGVVNPTNRLLTKKRSISESWSVVSPMKKVVRSDE